MRDERSEPDEPVEDERYVDDLIERGEAAEPDENGKLPPDATHELIPPKRPGERPRVVRRRFSAF
jgi:hypothetical protein